MLRSHSDSPARFVARRRRPDNKVRKRGARALAHLDHLAFPPARNSRRTSPFGSGPQGAQPLRTLITLRTLTTLPRPRVAPSLGSDARRCCYESPGIASLAPKGFGSPAQGCRAAATLGQDGGTTCNPNGVAALLATRYSLLATSPSSPAAARAVRSYRWLLWVLARPLRGTFRFAREMLPHISAPPRL